MSTISTIVLGIDVAQLKLDVALLSDGKTSVRQFDNSTAGFQRLSAWLVSLTTQPVHVCLEATGVYGDGVAMFLHHAGHRVSVVNPFRIKGYAQSKLQRNKTDRADARLIADFCLTQKPAQWLPPTPAVAELQTLTRRIEAVEQMLQMERNRLGVAPARIKPSITRLIKTFEKEIAALEQMIKNHLDDQPDLKAQSELLQTIPGIGGKTAHLLLAEIEFARYQSARQIAAFAGLTPQQKASGTSCNYTRLSKTGSGRIRQKLYFPAIVATGHNRIIKEFAARLKERGKTSMQIICAAMRKLLHIAFGVLKHQTPFDSNLAFAG